MMDNSRILNQVVALIAAVMLDVVSLLVQINKILTYDMLSLI